MLFIPKPGTPWTLRVCFLTGSSVCVCVCVCVVVVEGGGELSDASIDPTELISKVHFAKLLG